MMAPTGALSRRRSPRGKKTGTPSVSSSLSSTTSKKLKQSMQTNGKNSDEKVETSCNSISPVIASESINLDDVEKSDGLSTPTSKTKASPSLSSSAMKRKSGKNKQKDGKPDITPAKKAKRFEKSDQYDALLGEAQDLMGAAAEAQALGRLKLASSYLLLLHARLVGLGKIFDRAISSDDSLKTAVQSMLQRQDQALALSQSQNQSKHSMKPANQAIIDTMDKAADITLNTMASAKSNPAIVVQQTFSQSSVNVSKNPLPSVHNPPIHAGPIINVYSSTEPNPKYVLRTPMTVASSSLVPIATSIPVGKLTPSQLSINGKEQRLQRENQKISESQQTQKIEPIGPNQSISKSSSHPLHQGFKDIQKPVQTQIQSHPQPTSKAMAMTPKNEPVSLDPSSLKSVGMPSEIRNSSKSTRLVNNAVPATKSERKIIPITQKIPPTEAKTTDINTNLLQSTQAALLLTKSLPKEINLDTSMMQHLAKAAMEFHTKRNGVSSSDDPGIHQAIMEGISSLSQPSKTGEKKEKKIAWSEEEKEACEKALGIFGKSNPDKITKMMGGMRSETEVRAHLKNREEKEKVDRELLNMNMGLGMTVNGTGGLSTFARQTNKRKIVENTGGSANKKRQGNSLPESKESDKANIDILEGKSITKSIEKANSSNLPDQISSNPPTSLSQTNAFSHFDARLMIQQGGRLSSSSPTTPQPKSASVSSKKSDSESKSEPTKADP